MTRSYGADPETQNRLVPNPKRKALPQRVRARRQHLQALEAQLGRAVEDNNERHRPTVRGLKTTHARLRPQIDPERQVLARLENRLRHTPGAFPPPKWIAPAPCSARTAA